MHASLLKEKKVHMKFEGRFVDIMCEINSEYLKFVTEEKGKKTLYVLVRAEGRLWDD